MGFAMLVIPWGCTWVIPMALQYFPFTIFLIILLIVGNYVVVTLPLLKKQVTKVDLDAEGNEQYVDVKDDDGNLVYEKNDDGSYMMKDGKKVQKVERKVKTRTTEENRAISCYWLTCKKQRVSLSEEEQDS